MCIRRFRWSDLEQFTRLWGLVRAGPGGSETLDAGHVGEFLALPTCRADQNAFVAEGSDALVGFALVLPEIAIGRAVCWGGVAASHRRLGIGGRLARAAEAHARHLGAPVLHVHARGENAAAAGLLEGHGFQRVRAFWDMVWTEGAVAPLRLPQGFRLRGFRPGEDEEALTDVQNASFADTWGYCPNTVEEIRARTRLSRYDPQGIILALDGERVACFNWTSLAARDGQSGGRIEMTGVRPEYRGKGLGRAIILAGMASLAERGAGRIDLEVDSHNRAATMTYRSLGFRRGGQSFWFEKHLDGEADRAGSGPRDV